MCNIITYLSVTSVRPEQYRGLSQARHRDCAGAAEEATHLATLLLKYACSDSLLMHSTNIGHRRSLNINVNID